MFTILTLALIIAGAFLIVTTAGAVASVVLLLFGDVILFALLYVLIKKIRNCFKKKKK